MRSFAQKILPVALLPLLAACATQPSSTPPSSSGQGYYKVGSPYQVKGAWYTPHEDYSYDETGIASWYGEGFNHGMTANGEFFNKNELTAAHKTLPLPTLARVTNLENGRSIVVRINDRGPFSGARIIDVSQRAAQLLGFERTGTAKVRVQVLADESRAIADAMRHYGGAPAPSSPPPATVASVDHTELPEATDSGLPPPRVASVETKELAPVRTTLAIHRQLLATKPVAEVVQMPVTGANHIYIQAGSFTVLENATRLKQNLSRLGAVSISNIAINGRMFYRVRVGPIANVRQADTMLDRVRRAGQTSARTVVD